MNFFIPEHQVTTKPECIIFDWDNTLVNSWLIISEALNTALSAFELEAWSLQKVQKNVKYSLRDSFPKIFGDSWKAAAQVFYERYEEIHMNLIKPMSKTEEMLWELNELNISLCVVSNKRGDLLRAESDFLNWTHYFQSLIGANDASSDKPSQDPVEMALANTFVPRNVNVWFVGDSNIDIECAINSNCVPVLMREDFPEPGEFAFVPTFHFLDGEQLCKKIRTLHGKKY